MASVDKAAGVSQLAGENVTCAAMPKRETRRFYDVANHGWQETPFWDYFTPPSHLSEFSFVVLFNGRGFSVTETTVGFNTGSEWDTPEEAVDAATSVLLRVSRELMLQAMAKAREIISRTAANAEPTAKGEAPQTDNGGTLSLPPSEAEKKP